MIKKLVLILTNWTSVFASWENSTIQIFKASMNSGLAKEVPSCELFWQKQHD